MFQTSTIFHNKFLVPLIPLLGADLRLETLISRFPPLENTKSAFCNWKDSLLIFQNPDTQGYSVNSEVGLQKWRWPYLFLFRCKAPPGIELVTLNRAKSPLHRKFLLWKRVNSKQLVLDAVRQNHAKSCSPHDPGDPLQKSIKKLKTQQFASLRKLWIITWVKLVPELKCVTKDHYIQCVNFGQRTLRATDSQYKCIDVLRN